MADAPAVPTVDDLVERAALAAAEVRGSSGYVFEDGSYNPEPVVDQLVALAVNAECAKKAERAKKIVVRRQAMKSIYPDVVGPEGWAETSDPELSELLYQQLDTSVWRLTTIHPNGRVQTKLTAEHGLFLLRSTVNPGQLEGFYSSKALDCVIEDASKPARDAQSKRANRDAALYSLMIATMPEHAERFHRELESGLQNALTAATAVTAGALSAVVNARDEGDTGGEGVDGE